MATPRTPLTLGIEPRHMALESLEDTLSEACFGSTQRAQNSRKGFCTHQRPFLNGAGFIHSAWSDRPSAGMTSLGRKETLSARRPLQLGDHPLLARTAFPRRKSAESSVKPWRQYRIYPYDGGRAVAVWKDISADHPQR